MQCLPNVDLSQQNLRETVKTAATLLNKISESPTLFSGASDPNKETLPNEEIEFLKNLGRILNSALSLLKPVDYEPILQRLATIMSEQERKHFCTDKLDLSIDDPNENPYIHFIRSNLMLKNREKIRNIFNPQN